MSEPVVETLSAADIPSNVRLSNSVGWLDTEAEWRVIHEAALVLGARRDGELIGQGALGLYQGAGSIAKMLIAPDAQRQGIGAAILDGLLSEADSRSLPIVGLVATAFGRPLYESRGFEALGGVCILMGTPRLEEALAVAPPVGEAEQILAIERRFNGSSRTAVLCGRLRESSATALLAGGFALATAHEFGASWASARRRRRDCARSYDVDFSRGRRSGACRRAGRTARVSRLATGSRAGRKRRQRRDGSRGRVALEHAATLRFGDASLGLSALESPLWPLVVALFASIWKPSRAGVRRSSCCAFGPVKSCTSRGSRRWRLASSFELGWRVRESRHKSASLCAR